MTYNAEAVIELSAPLWLGPEFLGLLKPARIGGVDVHIALPDFERDVVGETVLHSRSRFDWVVFFAGRNRDDDRDWPFGGVAKWKQDEVVEFTAHRLLVLPRHRVTLAKARKFKAAVDAWVELFELWIEVVAREDLHRKQIQVERQGQSAFVWLARGKEPEGEFLPVKHRIMVHFGGKLTVSPWQWGKMLAKASAGATPPEAHVFLRNARHAKNVGHYRRSVLDSATAAELSLAQLRDAYLSNSDARLTNYVSTRARQIDGLVRFLKDMGRRLPDGIKNDLNEPRNQAIHAGHELDEETADAALGKAEEIADLAFPWKKLLK
jgi:hypothetical protein